MVGGGDSERELKTDMILAAELKSKEAPKQSKARRHVAKNRTIEHSIHTTVRCSRLSHLKFLRLESPALSWQHELKFFILKVQGVFLQCTRSSPLVKVSVSHLLTGFCHTHSVCRCLKLRRRRRCCHSKGER